MKKIILTIILVLSLSVSSFALDLPEGVYNATSLQIHMRKNFHYGNDRVIPNYFEYFQAPQILEFTRVGDCDDFSLYSWYYLSQMGYNPMKFILILKDDEELVGHAITVFFDTDNTFSVFSNQYIFKTLQDKPLNAIKDIYPTWQIIFIWTPTKIGYLTSEEVYKDTIPVDFVNVQTMMLYYCEYFKNKVLDYVDNL